MFYTGMNAKQMQEDLPALVAAYNCLHGSGSLERHLASIKTVDDGLTLLDTILSLKIARGNGFIITLALQSRDPQKRSAAHSEIRTITDRIGALPDAGYCRSIEEVYKDWNHRSLQSAYAIFEASRRIYKSAVKSGKLPPSEEAIRTSKWNIRMVYNLCKYSSTLKPSDRILERAALGYAFAQSVDDPAGGQEQQMIAFIAKSKALSEQKPTQSFVVSNGLIGPKTGKSHFVWRRSKRHAGTHTEKVTSKDTTAANIHQRHIPLVSRWRAAQKQTV